MVDFFVISVDNWKIGLSSHECFPFSWGLFKEPMTSLFGKEV